MSKNSPDYYKVLGVSKDASAKELKNARNALVKQHHPDVANQKKSSMKFREVQDAYNVLSDDSSRKSYDHEAKGRAEAARAKRALKGDGSSMDFGMQNKGTLNQRDSRWRERVTDRGRVNIDANKFARGGKPASNLYATLGAIGLFCGALYFARAFAISKPNIKDSKKKREDFV